MLDLFYNMQTQIYRTVSILVLGRVFLFTSGSLAPPSGFEIVRNSQP